MNFIKTPKGTELPLMNIKGKDYLQVAHRIVWFREDHPNWSIETAVNYEENSSVARATIRDENGKLIATATKREDAKGFADHIEKAETGAIGRALALCGYGTAAAIELDEGTERIVDSPIEQKQQRSLESRRASGESYLTEKQFNRMLAIGKKSGYRNDQIKKIMVQMTGKSDFYAMRDIEYETVCSYLEKNPPEGEIK